MKTFSRRCPVFPKIFPAITQNITTQGNNSDGYVFPNTLNQRKENRVLLTAFYKALTRAGIKNFRFHDLRHTFATRLVQNGVDRYRVQKPGRWKNVTMVQRGMRIIIQRVCGLLLK